MSYVVDPVTLSILNAIQMAETYSPGARPNRRWARYPSRPSRPTVSPAPFFHGIGDVGRVSTRTLARREAKLTPRVGILAQQSAAAAARYAANPTSAKLRAAATVAAAKSARAASKLTMIRSKIQARSSAGTSSAPGTTTPTSMSTETTTVPSIPVVTGGGGSGGGSGAPATDPYYSTGLVPVTDSEGNILDETTPAAMIPYAPLETGAPAAASGQETTTPTTGGFLGSIGGKGALVIGAIVLIMVLSKKTRGRRSS